MDEQESLPSFHEVKAQHSETSEETQGGNTVVLDEEEAHQQTHLTRNCISRCVEHTHEG